MPRLHHRRFVRPVLLLTLALTLLSLLPSAPVSAQGIQIQTLDNTQGEFARGVFQRTALSADLSTVASNPPDARGAVQLAPTGALKPWEKIVVELPSNVPNTGRNDVGTRADAGVVTLGNRLYVIAGTTAGGSTNTVLWANVNQVLGEILTHNVPQSDPRFVNQNWLNAPLPAAALVPNCAAQLSRRTRAATAALSTGGNTGFIYVVGGLTELDACPDGIELTASGVQIGAVAADGQISWSTSPNQLPSPPLFDGGTETPRGVEQATAVVVRTASGKAFLYVIGGLSTFIGGEDSRAERAVYRAEINPASGAIGSWTREADVPLPPELPAEAGIYNHIATHVTTIASTPTGSAVRDGLVVAGGFTAVGRAQPNTFVYRATIDPDSGALSWDDSPSSDNNAVSLGIGGQVGMSGVSYNNKLYFIGGSIPGNEPSNRAQRTVLTAVYDDNLLIQPAFPGSTDYFVGRTEPVLPSGPRVDTGAAVMDALPPPDNPTEAIGSAWVLVVGGSDQNGQLSRFLFRGRIGGDEADNSIRATDGWYYSNTFNVTFQQQGQAARNARVLAIRWSTDLARDANQQADMIVQFRKTLRADPNCPNDSVFSPQDQWFGLDGDPGQQAPFASRDGLNAVALRDVFGSEEFIATCFQYRVRFIQNGLSPEGVPQQAANSSLSPKLLNISIEKVVAGEPDLRLPTFSATAPGGRLGNLNAVVQNLKPDANGGLANTVDAGLSNDGGFFVHMCVAYAPPGQPAPTLDLPTLPLASGQRLPCMRAYYQVFRWQMTAGASLPLVNRVVNGNERQTWQDPNTDARIEDIRTLFSEPGTYRVALLVDAWNLVDEGENGKRNNRGEEPDNQPPFTPDQPKVITLEITGPPQNLLFLPITRR